MKRLLKIRKISHSKSFILLILLVIIIVGFQIANRNYLSSINIATILATCSLSGMITVGIALLLISGNCDLSAGAVGCMGGLLIAYLLSAGIPWLPAMLLVVVFGICAGLINAFLSNFCNIMPFIATLAMASVWKGIGNNLTNSANVPIKDPLLSSIGSVYILSLPLPFVIMLILFVLYGLLLNNTKFGRKIYIVGGSPTAAYLAGINNKKISTILMMNCSAIAALAGAIYAARMNSASPSAVYGSELDGITAAVIGGMAFSGGTGDMVGCFLGLLLINTFSNGLVLVGMNVYWKLFANGALLIAALTIEFFSERARRELAMV